MKKFQKIELGCLILFVISFIIFVFEALKHFWRPNSNLGIITGIASLILALAFVINYIIKVFKERKGLSRVILLIVPVLSIIFSWIYQNGVSSSVVFLAIIGFALELLMVGAYNIFYLYYYDEKKKMVLTLILYNLFVIYFSISGMGISYIHHYYIALLIPAIIVGYIEYIIRNVINQSVDK